MPESIAEAPGWQWRGGPSASGRRKRRHQTPRCLPTEITGSTCYFMLYGVPLCPISLTSWPKDRWQSLRAKTPLTLLTRSVKGAREALLRVEGSLLPLCTRRARPTSFCSAFVWFRIPLSDPPSL